MDASGLPNDIAAFIEWVGQNTSLYAGDLNYRERDRIKADMMNVPNRWKASRVTPSALEDKCRAVGLKDKDATEIAQWLRKRHAGRQLRPRYYKDFRFWQDPTDD